MKHSVAIIGTGISGMACARYLCDQFSLTLYERNHYTGGHTNTVEVKEDDKSVPIDTGFMVYNEATYPNLVRLFDELNVETMETDMSFGVQNRMNGLEYACSNLRTFFAQRLNYTKPNHWKLLREILRFFKEAQSFIQSDQPPSISLNDFLVEHNFGEPFISNYLLPMTAAIWSTPPTLMLNYPAQALFRFMNNHKLLGVGIQLKWRTVKGGSSTYRDKILTPLKDRIKSNAKVSKVSHIGDQVGVFLEDGTSTLYDHVILATHADEALSLLANPSSEQRNLLSSFQYTRNPVILHSDETVMPNQKRAWASWNFRMEKSKGDQVQSSTHYWMNSLQKVSKKRNYFVSVDYEGQLDPEKVHWSRTYEHPVFTAKSIEAQKDLQNLNDNGSVFFCGSYFKNGFHEDALVSALEVVKRLKERSEVRHELLSV